MLDYSKSYIEVQFPVSKLSKESYKERKAGSDQTLTCLGKWWGRKPLVLVRATIFGCLLPISDDPKKDREIFQELMGMNLHQLRNRKNKTVPSKLGIEFDDLSYDEKLTYCLRQEQAGDKLIDWDKVNAHLETTASSTSELVAQLSQKRFGRLVSVGDAFSGGGSIPFEAARMGCNAYGSDLSPLAGLLSWASIHVVGTTSENAMKLQKFLEQVFDKTCEEIDALEIEKNKEGQIAKYYLYCNEVICPECGYKVPLLPSFVVSVKYRAIVKLIDNGEGFDFEIQNDVSPFEMDKAAQGTILGGDVCCPHCRMKTSINAIKGGDGSPALRRWEKDDWKPRDNDVLQERLYAIKAVKLKDDSRIQDFRKKPGPVTDATFGDTYYLAPTPSDIEREKIVEDYVASHFKEWQEKGYIPNVPIVPGDKTDEPIRTKGWMYWHQLYSPRQLLFLGLLMKNIDEMAKSPEEIVLALCGINSTSNRFSKLSIWDKGCDKGEQTFSNQALNTLSNWACRSTYSGYELFCFDWQKFPFISNTNITIKDARNITDICDIWITDPPYADAVNYDELSEYFLAWDSSLIVKAFPDWYSDSKRALAVRGTGESFNNPMVEIYRNLANHMPDDGMQVVMFTHQNVKVWAELSMILWSAGLQVTSGWCIQTETASGLKVGNYVQGTVLLILRKRQELGIVFQDELFEMIRDEVHSMIDSMRNIDDKDNPDFNDNDYLLAAYAAALKVLTRYSEIEGVDVQYELTKAREASEDSPVTKIINQAKKEAYDYLVPSGIDAYQWTQLEPEERFFIKGYEANINGDFKNGTFQELARSFGVAEYKDMLGDTKANNVRFKTPGELKNYVSDNKFDHTLLRALLLALHVAIQEEDALEGRKFLKGRYEEDNLYWSLRTRMAMLLGFISRAKNNDGMAVWQSAAETAELLKAAIENDMI